MTADDGTIKAFLANPSQDEILHAISPVKGKGINETRQQRRARLAIQALELAAAREEKKRRKAL